MARQEADYYKGTIQVKADAYVLASSNIKGGQTVTLNLNDDIDNYSYLIGQGYVGGTILAEMYIPIGSIRGGSSYRLNYSDTSYIYWWDLSYSSDTKITAKGEGSWPSSSTLAVRILGIKEHITI